jgi:small conductance mechanosensitive channel
MNYLQEIGENFLPWFLNHGLKAIAILVVAYVVYHFAGVLIDRLIRKMVLADRYSNKEAEKKREDTLIRIFSVAANIIIWLLAALMFLQELGVDIAPLLAAAGIAGLAFGFGGQYLIRDIISGLFIIMENQYRIGDVVCFGDSCGTVEDISLRMTTLRNMDGTVHHVPHGEIRTVSNMSKNFARVNLNIGIAYNSNLEQVIRVVNKVGQELASDIDWKDKIIKAPRFLRVNDFADSSMVIKILGDTQPSAQWGVTGELRKRLKIAFDREGIEIPFPQLVVYQPKS